MSTSTLTSKGQITIPADVRERLGLQAGDRIEFVQTGDNEFTIVPLTQPVTALKGMLQPALLKMTKQTNA